MNSRSQLAKFLVKVVFSLVSVCVIGLMGSEKVAAAGVWSCPFGTGRTASDYAPTLNWAYGGQYQGYYPDDSHGGILGTLGSTPCSTNGTGICWECSDVWGGWNRIYGQHGSTNAYTNRYCGVAYQPADPGLCNNTQGFQVNTGTCRTCTWIDDSTPPSVAYHQDAPTRYTNASSGNLRTHTRATDNVAIAGVFYWSYNSTVEAPWYQNQVQGIQYAGSATDYYSYIDFPIRAQGHYITRAHTLDKAGNWNWGTERDSGYVVDWTPPNAYSIEGFRYTRQNSGTTRFHTFNVTDSLAGMAYQRFYVIYPGSGVWTDLGKVSTGIMVRRTTTLMCR